MKIHKKIALFISHIYGEYQKNLCTGIIQKASTYGYTVDIFASNDGETSVDLNQGESNILSIPQFHTYRGIILASGTYIDSVLCENILKVIKEKCTCPIVDINQNKSEFYNVIIDNNSPMEELVNHLICVHKYQRICYLGSSEEILFSQQRYKAYRKALKEHGLEPTMNHTYNCTYSTESIQEAVDLLLANKELLPDAIVCYNDTIALLTIKYLTQQGYIVPNDIAVTGYDNLKIAQNNLPSVTSVEFPTEKLGESAVEVIMQHIAGEFPPSTTIIAAHPVIATSCGCINYSNRHHTNYNLTLQDIITQREKEMITDINLSSSLVNITDIDEGFDVIADFVGNMPQLDGFYICLYPDWNSLPNNIKDITDYDHSALPPNDIILLRLGIKNGQSISPCSFSNKMILPEHIYQVNPRAFYYFPLYFKTKNFGYIALSCKDDHPQFNYSILLWLRNINNFLQKITSNLERTVLIQKLKKLYLRDESTDLLNAKGVQTHFKEYLSQIKTEQLVTIIYFQLDNLAYITNEYGQDETELLFTVLARSMTSNCSESDLCARLSWNEFAFMGIEYSQSQITVLINKIKKYIDNYSSIRKKPYQINLCDRIETVSSTNIQFLSFMQ